MVSMRRCWFGALLGAQATLVACGGGGSGGGSSFVIQTAAFATAGSTPPVIQSNWMVFFADEATSNVTDLNGDNDEMDSVAVAVRFSNNQVFELEVASDEAVIVDGEVYLAVREVEDGRDWNLDNDDQDRVLLHWSELGAAPTFVDELADFEPNLRGSFERLYYTAAEMPVDPDGTSLRYLDVALPTTPVAVQNTLGGGQLLPRIVGEEDGLLFAVADESDLGLDLNGDGHPSDSFVLGLLDTTDPAATFKNTGLALEGVDAPLAARRVDAADDWLVAVLVSELAQEVNLDDPSSFAPTWLPENCLSQSDGDFDDQVLHYIEYAAWFAGTEQPVNTGLSGTERVLVVEGFVATLAAEDSVECDLNDDDDTFDLVPRWVATELPLLPPGAIADMVAVEDVPGGSFGLSALGSRFVAVVSEANDGRDYDGQAAEHDLVAWFDPATSAAWDFTHNSGITGVPQVGADWMAARERSGRLGIAFQEELQDDSLNTNLACSFVAKDADTADGLPTWARFDESPATLLFPGVGYALATNNAGLVQAGGYAFFRVSEANDNRDYNSDGDTADNILFRNPLTTCNPVPMATASSNAVDVVFTDGVAGAAFFSSEAQAGVDFNDDGDESDLSLRWFRF